MNQRVNYPSHVGDSSIARCVASCRLQGEGQGIEVRRSDEGTEHLTMEKVGKGAGEGHGFMGLHVG